MCCKEGRRDGVRWRGGREGGQDVPGPGLLQRGGEEGKGPREARRGIVVVLLLLLMLLVVAWLQPCLLCRGSGVVRGDRSCCSFRRGSTTTTSGSGITAQDMGRVSRCTTLTIGRCACVMCGVVQRDGNLPTIASFPSPPLLHYSHPLSPRLAQSRTMRRRTPYSCTNTQA